MKKIISLLSLVVLSACAQATDAGNGLNRLDAEPKNCEYLYTMIQRLRHINCLVPLIIWKKVFWNKTGKVILII